MNMIYALRGDDIVHISEVQRGLKCRCTCPACGGRLAARKGNIKAHSFAHCSGEDCARGYETSLYLSVKDILTKAGRLTLPKSRYSFPEGVGKAIWTNGKRIRIDSVELEKKYGDVIPDVTIHSGKRTIFVEIFVTHAANNEKLQKLKCLGIPTMEIDLRGLDDIINRELLENIILRDAHRRRWIYDPVAENA